MMKIWCMPKVCFLFPRVFCCTFGVVRCGCDEDMVHDDLNATQLLTSGCCLSIRSEQLDAASCYLLVVAVDSV